MQTLRAGADRARGARRGRDRGRCERGRQPARLPRRARARAEAAALCAVEAPSPSRSSSKPSREPEPEPARCSDCGSQAHEARARRRAGLHARRAAGRLVVLGIVLTGLVNIFVSAARARPTTRRSPPGPAERAARARPPRVRGALRDRAPRRSLGGAGVLLTLPANARTRSGTVIVVRGRRSAHALHGDQLHGQRPAVRRRASPRRRPFRSSPAHAGDLPQLAVDLTVNTTGRSSDAAFDVHRRDHAAQRIRELVSSSRPAHGCR